MVTVVIVAVIIATAAAVAIRIAIISMVTAAVTPVRLLPVREFLVVRLAGDGDVNRLVLWRTHRFLAFFRR